MNEVVKSHVEHCVESGVLKRGKEMRRILARCEKYEPHKPMQDEQICVLLVACGFIGHDEDDEKALFRLLTESADSPQIVRSWMEMLPVSPRKGTKGKSEGDTHVDLIVGSVVQRGVTESGVAFDSSSRENGGVCFVEAKLSSDIATRTTHDTCRNQLARIIETAATFQSANGTLPDATNVHITLLTPRRFKEDFPRSRLYFYKYNEYFAHRRKLLWDIESATIEKRNTRSWRYPPDLGERLERLKLHWVTFEELWKAMPATAYSRALREWLDLSSGVVLS